MKAPDIIVIDGRPYSWRRIAELRPFRPEG
jgi:hypothetical protein